MKKCHFLIGAIEYIITIGIIYYYYYYITVELVVCILNKFYYPYNHQFFWTRPDHVGNALIEILEHGKTGETWIVEDNRPPRLID